MERDEDQCKDRQAVAGGTVRRMGKQCGERELLQEGAGGEPGLQSPYELGVQCRYREAGPAEVWSP